MKLLKSEKHYTPEELSTMNHSKLMNLNDILTTDILASPTEKSNINNLLISDSGEQFNMHVGSPLLFPQIILENILNHEIPFKYYNDSILQYYLLAQIKGSGEINAPSNSITTGKHFYNAKLFFNDLSNGILLDVGCDKPSLSHLFYPEGIKYVGLDPSFSNDEFKVLGMAEFLPFKSSSFDFVSFNTSLDHILDYHTAIEEAHRVLRPEGKILIASYAWLYDASLLRDSVHFHHFRENELIESLNNLFSVERIHRYEDIKGSDHRYIVFIEGKKI